MSPHDKSDNDLHFSLDSAKFDARRSHFMTTISEVPTMAPASPGRRRFIGAATLAGLTAVAAVGLTAMNSSPEVGQAAFAVSQAPTGSFKIRIVSTEATAAEMTRQLHSAGLPNVRVQTEAANPALVGTWVSGGGDGAEALSSQTEGYAATLEIPKSLTASLVLTVGRAPKAGEAVQVVGFRNLAAPGGPLACHGLSGATAAGAEAILREAGYTVSGWYSGNRQRPIDVSQATATDIRVAGVYNDDLDLNDHWKVLPGREHKVTLQVAPAGSALFNDTVWSGFPPSLRTGDAAKAGCA